jgi:hypothetical protein
MPTYALQLSAFAGGYPRNRPHTSMVAYQRGLHCSRESVSLHLGRFTSNRVPLAEAARAYHLLDQGTPDVTQVLIDYRA